MAVAAASLDYAGTLTGALRSRRTNAWAFQEIGARPGGDRESYGILWQTGGAPNFVMTNNAAGQQNIALSPLQFPNGFSPINGRRPAIATFRTSDTGINFAISVWHSVPGWRFSSGWPLPRA